MKIASLVVLFLCLQSTPPGEEGWIVPLNVRDQEGHRFVVRFGYHDSATVGFDRQFGEVPVPPVPSAPAFDVRFLDPRHRKGQFHGLDAYVDIRAFDHTAAHDTFYVRYQPADESFPVVVSWPASLVKRNTEARMFYRDAGEVRSVDMRSVDSLVLSNDAGNVLHIVCSPSRHDR